MISKLDEQELIRLLNDAEALLEKVDVVNSSKKLYEVIKYAILPLAKKYNLVNVDSFYRVAEKLSEILGEDIEYGWTLGRVVYNAGYLEKALNIELAKEYLEDIKNFVKLTRKLLSS